MWAPSASSDLRRGPDAHHGPERLDPRLRMVCCLLVPALMGHGLQIAVEDGGADGWERVAWSPGWHQHLHPMVLVVVASGLSISALATTISAWRDAPVDEPSSRSARTWALLVTVLFAAHSLTFPFRVRNHMSHLLAVLGAVALVSSIRLATGRSLTLRRADELSLEGVALVTLVTYFFAGLHKLNASFLDVRIDGAGASITGSAAIDVLRVLWRRAGLGERPPELVRLAAAWSAIVIELFVPFIAWRVARVRALALTTLCFFHVPHVSVMQASDYPMIMTLGYPAFLSREEAESLRPHLNPSAWNVSAASMGVALHLALMPRPTVLTAFGVLVMGLWGWGLGSLVARAWRVRAERRRGP